MRPGALQAVLVRPGALQARLVRPGALEAIVNIRGQRESSFCITLACPRRRTRWSWIFAFPLPLAMFCFFRLGLSQLRGEQRVYLRSHYHIGEQMVP